MKNYSTFLSSVIVLLFLSSQSSFAQDFKDTDKAWSVIKIDPEAPKEKIPDNNWVPAEQVPVFYDLLTGITVSPNFRPKPTTNTTQSELSIDVHPTNENIVFSSANATNWPVTSLYGTGVYWTLNGSTWTGFDNPPFGSNSGDPVSIIGTDGRFYENYILNSGQGVSVSTNNGTTWSSYVVTPNPGYLADKNHYMVDKKSGSPYENRSYCAWTDFSGANDGHVVLRYSTNFGATWSSIINLSASLTPGDLAQGVNIQTGPNGEVYVTYIIYDVYPGEDAVGFSKSTNGGVSWTHARIYSATNFGIRGNLSSKANIRVSSFPSMAVDRSGGPNNGNIYITWPQRGVTPAGTDPDIVVIKSTNGGATWTSPLRVNNDPLNNGKDQYYPWCSVDQATGQLVIVFYDSRNVPNSQAEVYMARSLDGGSTFENFKVSDQPHTPAPIAGLASGYAGDYIGVAALNNTAYPYWGDNRTGNYQGWMAKVTFGEPCPVTAATNPSPADGASNISALLPQLSWTNGTGATQSEVWFGPSGNMSMVYSGALSTSWNIPSMLNFNTTYNWQIISKNDTCGTASSIWSFTTELSPGIVFSESFNNLSCWTAIGPLGTTNWSANNSVNAGGSSPELRFNYSPQFNGLSKLVSCPVSVLTNRNYSINVKHMLDWYATPAPVLGIGVSYDNGATYTTVWSVTPTGNLGPATITASFTTPQSDSPEAINLYIVFFCNGNSYNIDYWYLDDLTLTDDDYFNVADPVNISALPISDSQINLSFTPNINNNQVAIAWNLTGIFTTPAGTPPTPGQPFAGGTLLYKGTASPVNHTGLNHSTTYYYKLFSYDNINYSPGVQANTATLTPPPAFQLSVLIMDGWNVVSIPGLHPVNQNVSTWWPGLDLLSGVFKFEGGYQPVTTAETKKGYWMKHIGGRVYNTGDEWPAGGILIAPHDPIPVSAGWNLIGGYEQTVPTAGITTVPPGLITGSIYKYSGGYIAAASIEPGYGYWVRTSASGQLILPSASTSIQGAESIKSPFENFPKITITDNSSRSYTLYAAENTNADLTQFELPPLPPSGMFDIRYSTQRYVEDLTTSQTIEMMGAVYPIKVKAEKIAVIISDELGREIARINAGEEVLINSGSDKLIVAENVIPREYSLGQNYPNPFNPGTMIRFSLPDDVKNVKLTVYNSLGEKITELVNTGLQAGSHEYHWDAGELSSGIYIYQLVTEKFVSTKKMMLLK